MNIKQAKTILYTIFFLSISILIIGYFLQTILIPIPDFNTLINAEIKKIQMEMAINYPLGNILFYIGVSSFILSGLLMIFVKLKKFKNNK